MSSFKSTVATAMHSLFQSEIGTDAIIQTAYGEIIIRGHLRDYVDDADLGSTETGLSRINYKTLLDELPDDFGQNSQLLINDQVFIVTSDPQNGEGYNIANGLINLDLRLEDEYAA